MPARQPAPVSARRARAIPRVWLMTDERADAGLLAALARLPRGAGLVFRHHATPPAARRRRYETVRALARRRGLVLVLAGDPRLAVAWRADGAHGRSPHRRASRPLLRTIPAHDRRDLAAARADLAFLSPVFPTRSHPGARTLGRAGFAALARTARCPVVALGGMRPTRVRPLLAAGAWGWAAIDAWDRPGAATARLAR